MPEQYNGTGISLTKNFIFLRYYNSIPPVTKTYAVACLFATGAYTLELYNIRNIALLYSDVFKRFQVILIFILMGLIFSWYQSKDNWIISDLR